MFVGIAIITAIRDANTLSALFFLSFTTMWLGFVTEMHSRPEADREKWIGDPDPVASDAGWAVWRDEYFRPKFKNYTWRMLPHVLGFFPYITCWVLIVNNFIQQINDLPEDLRDRIPDFVIPAVAGSIAIFSCFTFASYTTLKPLECTAIPCPVALLARCKFGINGWLPNTTGAPVRLQPNPV
tara:strand:- start:1264 stop:1812 length:549 start_codon:yes stop_codon:yes gene_type:complete